MSQTSSELAAAPGGPTLYAISTASEKLGVHPRTLMAYERIGLVRPERRSNQRRYSEDELRWLGCLQTFNREAGISLQGLSTMLRFVPCWAVRAEMSGEGACCPPAYPAGSCLDRVHQAYSGEAPEYCETCGIYQANRGASRSALAAAEKEHK